VPETIARFEKARNGVFDARDRIKPDTTRAVGVGRLAQHAEDEKANDNQLHGDR